MKQWFRKKAKQTALLHLSGQSILQTFLHLQITYMKTYLYAPMLVEAGEKMIYSSSPFDRIDIVVVVARKTEWKGSS